MKKEYTMTELARILGFTRGYIWQKLNRGEFQDVTKKPNGFKHIISIDLDDPEDRKRNNI